MLPACTWLMEGSGTGRGEVGCRGGGSGGRGSSGRGDRPPVICGPGTLSLPWTHLSSSGVRGRGVEMGGGGLLVVVGAPKQKMVYNDSHFPALSSLATTVRMVCQQWDGLGGWRDVGYDKNLDRSPLLFLFRGLAWWPPSLSPESKPYLFSPCHVARAEAL